MENFVALGKALPAGERVNVVGDVLLGHTPNDASYEPSSGENIQLGELLGRLHRVTKRKNVPDNSYFHPFGPHDECGGKNGTGGVDVEVGEVVLVHQGSIEAELFAHGPLVQVFAIRLGGQLWVAELVSLPHLGPDVIGDTWVCCLIEGVELHPRRPFWYLAFFFHAAYSVPILPASHPWSSIEPSADRTLDARSR